MCARAHAFVCICADVVVYLVLFDWLSGRRSLQMKSRVAALALAALLGVAGANDLIEADRYMLFVSS